MDESRSLHQRVLELAEAMAQPEERERPLLEALCTAAEADAAGRLRDDLTPESCGFAYLCAAAMLAVSGLLPCREDGGTEQFTAGDVSIRTASGGCGAGAALRRQAAGLMAEYWRDDGFAFVGVRG
ncbi:MAG: hypothetical protein HFF77_02990 [Oscillospiraceae bacterium]|jgi:hypothetical protein|nr:hypothetical protein [Oscillospiraceae bacterium]